ncbi:hypothetical protein NDU88_000849 [Pleurodeles waltl]|uniref:DDE Tnp4 domain-containing protein n=1 Tax=Pleurodeles waltl TaxID=8319 RepID=A0AAV7Q1H6_PLEWA|nr:hypothetical protein NDU88_000849 [Pleurodeles waltl]
MKMAVMSAEVTSVAVRIITGGALLHWLLGPILTNAALRRGLRPPTATVCNASAVTSQSHCPSLEAPSAGTIEKMAESSGVPTAGGPVDNGEATFNRHLQMVCLADQYISQVNAIFPGSVHDAYILRNSSIPDMMGQLQRHRVWLLGDSGYPNLSWLLTPVRNPRTRAEERYNEAHGRTRRVIERTFGLLKARFRCLHMTGGSLFYSPKKVCQIIIACSMLHNLALRRQVPFLQEDGPDDGVVAAVEPVEPVDSDEEEAEEEDIDNRESVIQQYFQ